jgi:hypothetical protein
MKGAAQSLIPWCALVLSLTANAWLIAGRQQGPAAVGENTSRAQAPVILEDEGERQTPREDHANEAHGEARDSAIGGQGASAAIGAYVNWMAGSLHTAEQIHEINRVITRWLAVDPQAASGWLLPRIQDGRFDNAVAAVSNWLVAHGEFERAAEWAAEIPGREVRLRALEEIYAEAFRNDLIDVEQLRASGLPEERIAGILDYSRLD